MNTTIGRQQSLFVQLVAKLISYAYDQGYELTFGEAYRPPEQAVLNAAEGTGISNSLHTLRLAIDLSLFRDGFLLVRSEDHLPLGAFWKSLHPLCRWGGDFSNPDHYSMEWRGRK